MDWHPIAREPLAHEKNAFALWYIPPGNYALATPADKQSIITAYPDVTHYTIVALPPNNMQDGKDVAV